MNPFRALAAATAMELSLAVAALALAGLYGSRNGWLDVINCFAPIILALALVAIALALASLDRGITLSVVLVLSGLAALYGVVLIGREVVRWPPVPAGEGAPFRVMSANVWSDNPTPDQAVAAILARAPDAVLLQETNGSIQDALPRLKALYPYSSDCPGAGVRIFVQKPITDRGCFVEARNRTALDLVWIKTTDADGRPLILATTHLGWPFPPRIQNGQRALLGQLLGQLQGQDVILTGDFNTTPWSYGMRSQDALLQPLRRQTLALFTWPARLDPLRRPWSLPILPIDHLYTSPVWGKASLTRVRIPGSDHYAFEASLRRRADAAAAAEPQAGAALGAPHAEPR